MKRNEWMRWRVIVGSILIGLVFAVVLLISTDREFVLSGLDLFFATTTVVALGFNLWQLFRDRYKYSPLKNSLIGLFNDLKARQLRAHERKLLITTTEGRKLDVEAVRIQFYDFVQEQTQGLEQLREHVVAAVHTLDPDVSTQQVFRAAEFGLNEQERRLREEGLERLIKQASVSVPPGEASSPAVKHPDG